MKQSFYSLAKLIQYYSEEAYNNDIIARGTTKKVKTKSEKNLKCIKNINRHKMNNKVTKTDMIQIENKQQNGQIKSSCITTDIKYKWTKHSKQKIVRLDKIQNPVICYLKQTFLDSNT